MLKSESKLDMTFASSFEIYEEDKKKRAKQNTWESKSHVIRTKILPYFGERRIAEIEPKDVIAWQNEMLAYVGENGEIYSPTYLKTIHAQLSAIFNHAVRYYHLPSGDCCRFIVDYAYELSNNYKYCGYNFTWGILISIFDRMPYGAICHNEGKQNRYAEGVSMFCFFYSIRPEAF